MMKSNGTIYALLFFSVSLWLCGSLYAQSPATTTVQDTVYKSDGTLASGSVVISWPSFISADNKPVFGGTKTVPLTGGALSVGLVPTVGATPSGISYTVKYFQSGGVAFEERWVVPSSQSPVGLSQVRVTAAPASNITINPNQVVGTAIVANPTGTQTITGPTSGIPLQLKGRSGNNANVWEVYDNAGTPALQVFVSSNGQLNAAQQIISGKFISGALVPVTYSATPAFDAGLGNSFQLTLTGNVTSSSISNGAAGQTITMLLCQDATGSRTFSWPANLKLAGGSFRLTTTANKCDTVTALYDGSNWYETSRAVNQ